MTITIRKVTSVEECEYFQELERRVWDAPEIDIMPIHTLITCIKNGGLILGAFADDGPAEIGGMIGATFGWVGVSSKNGTHKTRFCSHMAGVLPDYQRSGIGLQLKLAQRKTILEMGYTDWIVWTYDPLFRANGVFNIRRLGATCNTYYRNNYGVMLDGLNRGVPSDRCQVDWWLRSDRVTEIADRETGRQGDKETGGQGDNLSISQSLISNLQVLPTKPSGHFAAPVDIELRLDGAPIALPIPDDISAIRRSDAELSLTWRLYMRSVLEQTFASGYAMVDCVQIEGGWYYLLNQNHT